jgi:hypothetical protein
MATSMTYLIRYNLIYRTRIQSRYYCTLIRTLEGGKYFENGKENGNY